MILLILEKVSLNMFFAMPFVYIGFTRFYFIASIITLSIISSRFVTAKKLQRKLFLKDYINSAISFLCLPIGIFWIQNEINAFSEIEPDNKTRTKVLIGAIIILVTSTIYTLSSQELEFSYEDKNKKNTESDSLMHLRANKDFSDYFNSMDDSSKAEYTFKSALQLYDLGNFRSAIESLDYSISLDSTIADYYFYRGMYLFEQYNQMDSAIGDMTKTIELNPNNWKAYYYRSSVNYTLHNFDKSLQDVRKLIELDTTITEAYLLRGLIRIELNDKEGACLDFKKAYSMGNEEAHSKIRENCDTKQ